MFHEQLYYFTHITILAAADYLSMVQLNKLLEFIRKTYVAFCASATISERRLRSSAISRLEGRSVVDRLFEILRGKSGANVIDGIQ